MKKDDKIQLDELQVFEIVMTFLQLSMDEWQYFCNLTEVQKSPKKALRMEIRENITDIFRSVKNKYRQYGIADEYEEMILNIADNADELEKLKETMYLHFLTNVQNCTSYNNYEPFKHALCTGIFLLFAKKTILNIFGKCKNSKVDDTISLIKKIPYEYRWEEWKEPKNLVNEEIMIKMFGKIVEITEKKRLKNITTL